MKKILKISIVFLFIFIGFNINSKTYASIKDVKVIFKSSFTYTGNPITPSVIVKDKSGKILKKGTDYSVSYSSNINVGTGKIKLKGLKLLYSGEIIKQFTIKPKSIQGYKNNVKISPTSFIYNNGKPMKPSVNISGLQSKNYIVEYFNNKNAGTAKVKITGVRNYKDSITKSFTIGRKNISNCFKISYNKTYTYTGSQIKPQICVTAYNGRILKSNKDYTVTYSNNINAGTAKIIITGKGNFLGSITKKFTINRKKISVYTKTKRKQYKNDGHVKVFPVNVYISKSNKKLVKDVDYVLYYRSLFLANTQRNHYYVDICGRGNYEFNYTQQYYSSTKNPTITIGNCN